MVILLLAFMNIHVILMPTERGRRLGCCCDTIISSKVYHPVLASMHALSICLVSFAMTNDFGAITGRRSSVHTACDGDLFLLYMYYSQST